MVEKYVYNLEFPPHINEIKIGDYLFKRVDNYSEVFGNLQHLVNSSGSEFPTNVKTGSHQITALVQIPQNEKPAVLPWEDIKSKQVLDVLFLLSIFTGRNIFTKEWEDEENIAITADHRKHLWGAQLLLSLRCESKWKHKHTGEIKDVAGLKGVPIFDYHQINIGFEKSLNAVLDLISSKKWQEKYFLGYFLFIYREAVQLRFIEGAFILCWSIWEHIFTLHNNQWLDSKDIEKLSGYNKISFILSEYFLFSIDNTARKEIGKLATTRNRIVHYGKKADSTDHKEMEMFIRLTEQLMAIVLELQPSNAFNSTEKLRQFLGGR